jgi:DNA-binding response OmpR family regulator
VIIRFIFADEALWKEVQGHELPEELLRKANLRFCPDPITLCTLLDDEVSNPLVLVLNCDMHSSARDLIIQKCHQMRTDGRSIGLIGCLNGEELNANVVSAALKELQFNFDDIILTPVRQNELLFRLEKVMHKVSRSDRRRTDGLHFGPLQFDLRMMTARANNEQLRLTRKETELLLYLAYRAEKVVDRESLVRDLWHGSEYSDSIESVLNGHLSRIRDKLGRVGCRGILKTVRGIGISLSLKGYKKHWSSQSASQIENEADKTLDYLSLPKPIGTSAVEPSHH